MGLRETINQNSAVVTVGAVVLLIIALGVTVCSISGGGTSATGPGVGQQWFLDEGTNKLFAAEADAVPPIQAPSGKDGVRAYVFTCDKNCGGHNLDGKGLDELEELGLFVGYVEKISPRGIEHMERIKQEHGDDMAVSLLMSERLMEFTLVRQVGSERWYPFVAPQATKIQSDPHTKCQDRRFAKPCMPGMQ